MTREEELKAELSAIRRGTKLLEALDPAARARVLAALAEKYAPVPAAAHHEKPAKP